MHHVVHEHANEASDMDKLPPINVNWPDPLKHFAKDHPGWRLTVYALSIIGRLGLSALSILAWYLWNH